MNQISSSTPSPRAAVRRRKTTMTRLKPLVDAAPRVALIHASWHAEIVGRAVASIEAHWQRRRWPSSSLRRIAVPGAFEIPLHAQRLAQSGEVDAIIACALVVNGGIYRHEFVAAAVIDGLMRVQLDTGVPVFSAVLTPRDFHEHEEHRHFFAEQLHEEG